MDKAKCANAACDCVPEKGEKFCSAFCEAEEDQASIVCRCGHAGCKGDVTTAQSSTSTGSYQASH